MRNPIHAAKLFVKLGQLVRNLDNLNNVIELSQLMMKLGSKEEYDAVVADFRSSKEGESALESRSRLGKIDFEELAQLPQSTLGGAYARFMKDRKIYQESLDHIEVHSDIDYVRAHLYETHDLWHVIAGFETDPAGEVGVQALYMAQVRSYLPLFIFAAVFLNTALSSYEDRNRRLDALTHGWLMGKKAKSLIGVEWRHYFETPLNSVRSLFNIIPFQESSTNSWTISTSALV